MRTLLRALPLALSLLCAPSLAAASEALWALLAQGGQVVLIRHALTVPGTGDPPGMRLEECATQRNLSDAGRAHARRLGGEFRRRGIPVARILSSPWCRCMETARLAFGEPEVTPALANLFGRPGNREAQVRAMKALVAAAPTHGGNLVLVSHGSTIFALTGVSPAAGEMVIVTPPQGAVAGRLSSE